MEEVLLRIPEWAKERRVYVFLGRECYMVREPGEGWCIKVVRCNFCGKCCEVTENWPLGTKEMDGKLYCKHLHRGGSQYFCEAGSVAPFSCASDKPQRPAHEDCVIRYERSETHG